MLLIFLRFFFPKITTARKRKAYALFTSQHPPFAMSVINRLEEPLSLYIILKKVLAVKTVCCTFILFHTFLSVSRFGILALYCFGILNVKMFSRKNLMRLRNLREQKKISQLKLAMDLNMNQNSISRYETGEHQADYETLIKFADYFDVSIDYLLERTDNPKINR